MRSAPVRKPPDAPVSPPKPASNRRVSSSKGLGAISWGRSSSSSTTPGAAPLIDLDPTEFAALEKAIVRMQRAIRTRWAVYRNFGPEIFHDHKGERFSGVVRFYENKSRAKWLKVSDLSSVGHLNMFLTHHWALPKPE
eukprot:3192934-Prymnesium_polylepis.1